MNDKLEKAVDAIVNKTESGKIEWKRMDDFNSQNPFYRKYLSDNYMAFDKVNNYMAPYNEGYIFFTNQTDEGYREVAVQPKEDSDITVLSTGRSEKLKTLEEVIKNELDNPDDFINSLIEE